MLTLKEEELVELFKSLGPSGKPDTASSCQWTIEPIDSTKVEPTRIGSCGYPERVRMGECHDRNEAIKGFRKQNLGQGFGLR